MTYSDLSSDLIALNYFPSPYFPSFFLFLHFPLCQSSLRLAMQQLDKDGNGTIDIQEFSLWYVHVLVPTFLLECRFLTVHFFYFYSHAYSSQTSLYHLFIFSSPMYFSPPFDRPFSQSASLTYSPPNSLPCSLPFSLSIGGFVQNLVCELK